MLISTPTRMQDIVVTFASAHMLQCPQGRCNGGLGKPNWAVREKNLARLEGREVPSSDNVHFAIAVCRVAAKHQSTSDLQPTPAQSTHSDQAAQPGASTQPMDTSSALQLKDSACQEHSYDTINGLFSHGTPPSYCALRSTYSNHP